MSKVRGWVYLGLVTAVFTEIVSPVAWGGEKGLLSGSGLRDEEIISSDELRKMQTAREAFLLVDARSKKSYDEAHIEGAVLPLTAEYYRQEELFSQGIINGLPDKEAALAEAMGRYPKNTEIVTYCNDNCSAAEHLSGQIRSLGFTRVRVMEGGIQSWEKKGYPVEKASGL